MGLLVLLLVPSLLQLCTPVIGHGNMVFPYAWWDVYQAGSYWDHKGSETKLGCGVLDLPENEFEHHSGHPADCMRFWFSNKVEIPGHAVLPEYMSQEGKTCVGQAGAHDDDKKFPWNAPGTAPVFSSCGRLGGHCGNHHDGQGDFGDCCSDHCDSFANGKNAEEYNWHHPPVTEWKAGSTQEVAWYVSANHAGGYSYRLCKMSHDDIDHPISEECFQENPLDFVGDVQMVQYGKDRVSGHRTEVQALQTTQGTFPEGSMWRSNPIVPHREEGSSSDYGHGHIYDEVRVPEHLEPGEYVLSFRWDCKCSPQVWTACANIEIV